MARFKINAGVDIETATPHEISGMLDSQQQSWFAEMARGLKHFRFELAGAVATGAVDMADAGTQPRPGFVWAVRRLSVDQLGTGDALRVYRTPSGTPGDPQRFLYQLSATSPSVQPGSAGLILHGGEGLEVRGTGLVTTAAVLVVTGEAIEAPEFMMWKLF